MGKWDPQHFLNDDVKAETPVLWLLHVKTWLIGKDSDAGRDWGQEEKGTTEDEMAGWHHWLNGHESGWTLGVGDGQGGLVCCSSWGRKESDMTERLNWTELKPSSTQPIHELEVLRFNALYKYKVPLCYCCLSVFYTELILRFILHTHKNLPSYLRLCDPSAPTSLAENPGACFLILRPGPWDADHRISVLSSCWWFLCTNFLLLTVPHLQARSQVWPTWHGPESPEAKCLWVYYQPNVDILWVLFQKRSAYPNNESLF